MITQKELRRCRTGSAGRTNSAFALLVAAGSVFGGRVAAQQPGPIQADALRQRLFVIAADSMGGRDTGSRGNWLTAEYVAAQFRSLGLSPAGDAGSFFQTIPFRHVHADTAARLIAAGRPLRIGVDVLPGGGAVDWSAEGERSVYGGVTADSTTWPSADALRGRLVVLEAPAGPDLRRTFARIGPTVQSRRMAGAAGFAIMMLDRIPADVRDQILQGSFTTNTATPPGAKPILLVTRAAGMALLGADPSTLSAGSGGVALSGGVRFRRDPLPFAARNVVAMLPGSDAGLRGTYVSVTAHNDHVGYTFAPVDHDSVYAHNRVVRPMGADSPDRTPTPEERVRIAAMLDSLRALRPDRPDSVFNGADDDGTGTVALIEVARALSAGPRPRRSMLFISHAAEERGLLGSQWFTDHATVPIDSIIGEADMDMVGRGNASDLPEGSPAYLEVVGASRLSHEYGALLETVNARQPMPFRFNYTYDAPGHPLQYYCRADHYSYARYGIPAFAVSRGEHADYHQVTDEPEYIDYNALARVANLILDFTRTVANLEQRPVVDGPHGDPHAPCRQ